MFRYLSANKIVGYRRAKYDAPKIIAAVRQHGAGNNKRLRLDNSG